MKEMEGEGGGGGGGGRELVIAENRESPEETTED